GHGGVHPEYVVDRRGVAVVGGQRGQPEGGLDRAQQAVVGGADRGDGALADAAGAEHERGHPLGRVLVVEVVLVEGDDGERPLGPPGRRPHDRAQLLAEEVVAGPDPAAFHVGAVVRTDPGQVRGGGRAPQVTGQGGERRQVRGAVGGPVPDAGEIQERQIVV